MALITLKDVTIAFEGIVAVENVRLSIEKGDYLVTDTVCVISTDKGDKNLSLMQKWPVRRGRPYAAADRILELEEL